MELSAIVAGVSPKKKKSKRRIGMRNLLSGLIVLVVIFSVNLAVAGGPGGPMSASSSISFPAQFKAGEKIVLQIPVGGDLQGIEEVEFSCLMSRQEQSGKMGKTSHMSGNYKAYKCTLDQTAKVIQAKVVFRNPGHIKASQGKLKYKAGGKDYEVDVSISKGDFFVQ